MNRYAFDLDAGQGILLDVSSLQKGFERCPEIEADSVVAVTYDRSADEFLEAWRQRAETVPNFVRIVTVGRTMRSASSASSATRNVVHPVQRRDDLEGVRTAIESALETETGTTALVFDSLTAPLEHTSLGETMLFVANVTDCLAATDAVGYFCFEADAHDPSVIAALRAVSDEMAELSHDGEWTTRSPTESEDDRLSLDCVFAMLRSNRRRSAIRCLLRTTEPISVEELTTAVAEYEEGETVTQNQHRRYYSTLYQLHLPKLADAGLIEYDESNHEVSTNDSIRWVEPFLALTEESAF